MIITAWNTDEVNKILVLLNKSKEISEVNKDKESIEFFDELIQIVKQWKFDHSQWDFKQDHYRQAVSFLMWVAEDTGKTKNDSPEYFEARFFDRLKSYKALEHRFNERYEKGKKEIENNEKK